MNLSGSASSRTTSSLIICSDFLFTFSLRFGVLEIVFFAEKRSEYGLRKDNYRFKLSQNRIIIYSPLSAQFKLKNQHSQNRIEPVRKSQSTITFWREFMRFIKFQAWKRLGRSLDGCVEMSLYSDWTAGQLRWTRCGSDEWPAEFDVTSTGAQ